MPPHPIAVNLHHLRLFHAVARNGTLTGAARQLNLSPSALSAQLRTLEATLGHELFTRQGRGLVLTEAGRIALDHADTIFRTAQDMAATLRHFSPQRQALRVGALATLSRNFQMRFLAPVLGRGDVELVLRSGGQEDLLRALAAMALDVVLTNLAPPRDTASPYLIHRLAAQPVALVGRSGRQAAGGGTLADALRGQPLILPTAETALRAGIDALLARLGVRPLIVAEVEDMAMIRLLLRADAGLAIIPPIVVQDELAAGSLTVLHPIPALEENFFAVMLERRFPNALAVELCKAGA
jgi:LysR family transcriptional regulator, transcriptional activator of nhaA